MYKAFKPDKSLTINYKLDCVTMGNNSLQATGLLNMAGNTETSVMTASAKVLANGDVQISRNQKLNIKNYKMVPLAVVSSAKAASAASSLLDVLSKALENSNSGPTHLQSERSSSSSEGLRQSQIAS
jgi:hypothetical protein